MSPDPAESTKPLNSRVVSSARGYYGWTLLAAATLGMFMTAPGQTLGVSVFLDRIIEDLGLTRSTVSLLYTIGTLTGALTLPFVGRFIDRHGPRVGVVVIASLFALACVFMGLVQGLLMLLVGFVLIRALGQGSLSLVSLHAVNIWFVRRRGLAVGLLGLGMAAATAVFPLLIEVLIGAFEWRGAYMVLGLLVAVVMIPVGALFYRVQPERYGLRPDGLPVTADAPREQNYSVAQARRTRTFWLFTVGDFLVAMLGTALIFHHYSIMASTGLDRVEAATVFVPIAAATAGANLLGGALMDRVQPRFLLSGGQLLLALTLALAALATGSRSVFIYGAVLGATQGFSGAVKASVHAYYFGRKYIGAIKGLVSTISVAGTSVGPLVVALGFDAVGSYTPVLLVCAAFPLIVALLAPWLKPWRADGSVA
ncbi:MAG TPA: MFS transporter [Trueperaceae bacterium]|nr:MFS transporter [Trueperaceae bacterium]